MLINAPARDVVLEQLPLPLPQSVFGFVVWIMAGLRADPLLLRRRRMGQFPCRVRSLSARPTLPADWFSYFQSIDLEVGRPARGGNLPGKDHRLRRMDDSGC